MTAPEPLKLRLQCGSDRATLLFSPQWSMQQLLDLVQLNVRARMRAASVARHRLALTVEALRGSSAAPAQSSPST